MPKINGLLLSLLQPHRKTIIYNMYPRLHASTKGADRKYLLKWIVVEGKTPSKQQIKSNVHSTHLHTGQGCYWVHFSPKWKLQCVAPLLKEKHLQRNMDKTITYIVTVVSIVEILINIGNNFDNWKTKSWAT